MNFPIVSVGMEELPDLYAERLTSAGFPTKRLTQRSVRSIYHIMNSRGFVAVYPLPYWRHFRLATTFHKPSLAVWIGSDVYRLKLDKRQRAKLEKNKQFISAHIADSPQLVEELAEFGITATWVPTISRKMQYSPLPLPKMLAVLSYLTPDRHVFYGSAIIKKVAEMLPDVTFIIVGGFDFAPDSPPNIRIAGYVADMDQIYEQTAILLRPTLHDGLSQMVLEALGRGRQVIWSMPFPHCLKSNTPEQIAGTIRRLISSPTLNLEGAKYVAENFTPEEMIRRLGQVAEQIWQR